MNPHSRLGYLGIAEETSAGAAIFPDTFVELQSESIVVSYPVTPVTPISSKRDINTRPAKEKIEISGDLTILVEANNIGEFLQNFAGAPTTSTITSGVAYQHVWTLGNTNEKTYTFDVKPADATYVMRYTGVKISQMAFSQVDNKIQCVLSIVGQKAFTNARITKAANNTVSVELDQTSGLTTDDTVRILNASTLAVKDTASVSAIGSELALTLGAASTAAVGDIVVIQKSTPIYTVSDNMIFVGGSVFSMKSKNDRYNPIDNVAAKELEDFSLNFMNELEARYTADGANLANRFPKSVKVKGFSVNGNLVSVYTTSERIDDMRSNEQVALRLDMYGKKLESNSAVAADVDVGTGNAGFSVAASAAGEAGNDLNITIITNSSDTLSATKTGNNILVKLASTTTTSNTSTLVTAAVTALTGVIATASGSGASTVVVASKANFTGGRDANEKELLRVDLNHVVFDPFNDNVSEDDLVVEDIPFNAYYDSTDSRTCKILLRNAISSY